MTKNFLKDFQQEHHLTADGIVGKQTAAQLMSFLDIKSISDFSSFLGQVKIESAGFTAFRENLYYSKPETLKRTFPKYFKSRKASDYIKNPEKLGNYIYANRMGNGDESSGDGYKYRGFGGIQLTGKGNILGYLRYMGLSSTTDLKELETFYHFFMTSKYFFEVNELWKYCKECSPDSVLKLSKAINLGNINSTAKPNHAFEREQASLNYLNLLS